MTRFFKRMVDPTESEDRAEPRVPRDMMIAASNEHVLAYDNVSRLTPAVSDTICRIATGASSTQKTLYTDKDETIIKAQRPQIINAIEDVAIRPDLIERSLFLAARHITENGRRSEKDFWADFERDRGMMLGFLLTSISAALKNLPHVKLPKLPRMADFAEWSVAAEPAWGVERGTFLRVYAGNQADAQDSIADTDALVQAVVAALEQRDCLSGQPQTVLEQLAEYANGTFRLAGQPVFLRLPDGWPTTPRGLTNYLARVSPLLRKRGIEYRKPTPNGGIRKMYLCRLARVDTAA